MGYFVLLIVGVVLGFAFRDSDAGSRAAYQRSLQKDIDISNFRLRSSFDD